MAEQKELMEQTSLTGLANLKDDLNETELQQAQEYARSLQSAKQNTIINYGKEIQDKMSGFTDQVLENVKNKDTGEVGDSLRDLVSQLNAANPEKLQSDNRNGILKLFSKMKRSVFEMTARYQEVSAQIDGVSQKLAVQESTLLKDNDTLDTMYEANMAYYRSLNTLLVGGQLRKEELGREIKTLKAKLSQDASNQMQVQELNDLNAQVDRLDRRLNDLMLTREITIQQAPQIRMIQNANSILSEKIQASINTAIPLWKNQVAISLSLLRQKDAVNAQNAVTDATNDLLKKNSQMLRQSTIDVVKATQRGVVDVETLRETQDNLIATMQEVMTIQAEGQSKRQDVAQELTKLENDFKQAMLRTGKQERVEVEASEKDA
ncbi:toxic anion resistance protein [Ligilactobacillus equi]|uniref:Tellurite resistance protein n=1 Tax=Ligilactobacillus equi DPC 6820 TaxID=1392007 RepID=V7HVQ4_9LACO|nr:toxic anion resistance protein [Ligilactobacillus equi]ETA73298.1 hypothetical protein LEQ_1766c [Ligilactobacillus equi DPC 6820]